MLGDYFETRTFSLQKLSSQKPIRQLIDISTRIAMEELEIFLLAVGMRANV
jgi:hypothetical protein